VQAVQKWVLFLTETTYLRKEGNKTKIRSILYILRGVCSRFQASGPGETMIQPCIQRVLSAFISCQRFKVINVAYKTAVYALVNGVITHQKQQMCDLSRLNF